MALFKEIYCTHCGEKTKLLARMKLEDGNYLCSRCASVIPSYMKDSVADECSLDDYRDFLEYIAYSNTQLRPLFHETHSYYSIHIDAENQMFYLGYEVNDKTIFLKFYNINDFNLIFRAEEYKEGMLGDKVKGELLMNIKMNSPCFYHEEVLDYSAKAKAKTKLFSSIVEYENPKGMDQFLSHFMSAWKASLDEAERARSEYAKEAAYSAPPSELQQAMRHLMQDTRVWTAISEHFTKSLDVILMSILCVLLQFICSCLMESNMLK